MEILGVGPQELIFIVVIALIILGPKDMQKAGKTIGKWMRDIVTSDGWKIFQQTSRELRNLPTKLMRDANEELNQINNEINSATGPAVNRPNTPNIPLRSQPLVNTPPVFPENKIAPTPVEPKPEEPNQEKNA
ncbi:MAG: twin-arginine translocase TatA/TatE family subunit [Anaerolineales bacterium]